MCKLSESHLVLLLRRPGKQVPKGPRLSPGFIIELVYLVLTFHEHHLPQEGKFVCAPRVPALGEEQD